MYYELLRTDTLNVVGDYPALAEALAVVRRATEAQGDQITDRLALVKVKNLGDELENVASGAELLNLLRSGHATHGPSSESSRS